MAEHYHADMRQPVQRALHRIGVAIDCTHTHRQSRDWRVPGISFQTRRHSKRTHTHTQLNNIAGSLKSWPQTHRSANTLKHARTRIVTFNYPIRFSATLTLHSIRRVPCFVIQSDEASLFHDWFVCLVLFSGVLLFNSTAIVSMEPFALGHKDGHESFRTPISSTVPIMSTYCHSISRFIYHPDASRSLPAVHVLSLPCRNVNTKCLVCPTPGDGTE